jgi:hypothetical protein
LDPQNSVSFLKFAIEIINKQITGGDFSKPTAMDYRLNYFISEAEEGDTGQEIAEMSLSDPLGAL